jgi:hypothetical protein
MAAVADEKSGQCSQLFKPRINPTSPKIVATAPPTSNHMALSVGASVKNREKSELTEFAAVIPKITNAIPPARMASEIVLSIEKSP